MRHTIPYHPDLGILEFGEIAFAESLKITEAESLSRIFRSREVSLVANKKLSRKILSKFENPE